MNIKGIEYFEDLLEYHNESNSIKDKYPKMRSLLERICKDLSSKSNIQFSNLFSRLNYVCDSAKLDKKLTFQINTLRVNANKVLHAEFNPTNEEYLQDLKALSRALGHFYNIGIPDFLKQLLPKSDYYRPNPRKGRKHERIRVEVSSTDNEYIYGIDEENPTEDPIKIKHHVNGINEEFNNSIDKLWKGCQLNLIDVTIDENGTYLPDFLILEPDYLIDISSLSECMKEYGKDPLNYIQNKFEPIKNSSHILIGNVANLFLDEFVNEKPGSPVIYADSIKKAFKSSPIEFSTCEEIDAKFFQETQVQFQNINGVITNTFPKNHIDREMGILEPNFICEHLGVQGRLDFLQLASKNGHQVVIELKAGKAPFPETNFELVGLNHQTQAFIYQIVIQLVIGVEFSNLSTFILYSKYSDPKANLRMVRPYLRAIKEAMNIRNLIIANERKIASDSTGTETKNIINSITPETLVTNRNLNQNFAENHVIPQINRFSSIFQNATDLELEYFHCFYSFVTKEHYKSKVGDSEYESVSGISSLWLLDLEDKIGAGEILIDLVIVANLTEGNKPTIKLKIPKYTDNYLSNFRKGDIVILYEKIKKTDNVTNRQIYKGSIEQITQNEIMIRLRYKQRNSSALSRETKYAIEHDFLDSSYVSMYRGLYSFLHANKDRKELILSQRQPKYDLTIFMENVFESPEIQEIVSKAKRAKDYFLLLGPPGTGKTSVALKSMVEEFYSEPTNNILLLSHTNRAVDEICEALKTIKGSPSFVRIGAELSCGAEFREKLLENVIKDCNTREEVRNRIKEHRIFVGTVASFSNKLSFFRLKHFQVAIVDEASQILEPSLIGILSAKNYYGGNAIEKFILIGDHKQLPAIVLQKEGDTEIDNQELNKIGLSNAATSLFERLFNLNRDIDNSPIWGILLKQGRMHPDIVLFPNYAFYKGQLEIVPRSHQISALDYAKHDLNNSFHKLIVSKRIAFLPSERHISDKSNKTNTVESRIIGELVRNIYQLYSINSLTFNPEKTIGIITPYRSQIALIKREIHELKIPDLEDITVDTVERFQGSERDIIIYSCSINEFYQLDFISNYIIDKGQFIDRKLNVAITRARKQLFIVGNPSILSNNLTYFRLIEFIRSKSGYIDSEPEKIISGDFVIEEPDTDIEIGSEIYEPSQVFVKTFEGLIIKPIRDDSRTRYPNYIFGHDSDYNRMNVVESGRANFDQSTIEHSSDDKVNLYCFYNMRKHYFTSIAIFRSFDAYFKKVYSESNMRITIIDFGCGPLTGGLAINQHFSYISNFHFDYIGIDTSNAMLRKARQFAETELFSRDTGFIFYNALNGVPERYWKSIFILSNAVIFNCSYFFGNLNNFDAGKLAEEVNILMDKYPLNQYMLVFQNSAIEKRNRSYNVFKKLVPRLQSITQPKIEKVIYRNAIMSNYDKSETVYYEILST